MNLKTAWVPISMQIQPIKKSCSLFRSGTGLDSLVGFPTWLKEGSSMDAPSKCHASKQGPRRETASTLGHISAFCWDPQTKVEEGQVQRNFYQL